MKFLKLQNTKFTLLLISALGTASCVFLPQSLILHKENRISLFSQNSVGFPPSSLTDKIPWEELSYLAKQGLSETKSNLQKIILDYKKFPISEDFLSFVNDNIKQIEQDEDYDDYRDIKRIQRIFLLHNYKIWKQAFLNSDDLVLTSEDKDEWKKIFIQKSNEIKTLSEQNQTINSQNYLKDFYIYKLKEQIKLYEKYPYYLQPLERLKKILYYYQNNYGEFVDFQWGIDKNGKFSLEPSKYYSGNYQRIKINDEYIKNWIKYYQRWNWVFVKTDDQISKIEDKDILALQIDKKFKDNKIISDYLERQINFQPNRYFELWNINEQHPEKVNYNDVKQKGLRIFSGYYNKEISVISEINKLNLSKVSFQKPTVNFKKDLFDNKEYEFLDWSSIKKFDYKKFYNYQKLVEIKDEYSLGSIEGFSIYNNLLFEKPNLFSDGLYKSINSELIKPVQIRKKENGYIVDYTTELTDEEVKKGKSAIDDAQWINPIPEYKKWFNHWKEILPKIIDKNWDSKKKIKTVAYYIATNSLYLSPIKKKFNYNGYGFYNPTQIFTNDPEIQCVGYSMNLAAALTILNIPVRILGGPVVGDASGPISNGSHAWNEVFVDGRWKAINLTWFDYNENSYIQKTFELKDDEDLFLERSSEHMNQFKLDIASYQSTIMFFKNTPEYEYKDLPDSI